MLSVVSLFSVIFLNFLPKFCPNSSRILPNFFPHFARIFGFHFGGGGGSVPPAPPPPPGHRPTPMSRGGFSLGSSQSTETIVTHGRCHRTWLYISVCKGGGTYFHLGGGGAKTKKGTIMSKRALTVHMQIISLMC